MIALITYDAPHRKTQDLLTKLILKGYSEIRLVVIPWVSRKNFQPIYRHRPSARVDLTTEELCERLNIAFERVEINELDRYFTEHPFDHIMIAGAGILPEDLAKNHKVINSHPGFLPNMKGLDAFKWAIYNAQPIGVTTHYISEKADEGELIDKQLVPIYREDTFHSLAYRVYEKEIQMMVEAIGKIESGEASLESLADDSFEANRRMPNRLEAEMMEKFEELRKNSDAQNS